MNTANGNGNKFIQIAGRFGCKVRGANISPEQNKMNLKEAKKLGVGELVDVTLCNFNDGLPFPDNSFSHIVSCEVLCHAANKPVLFQELKRVLKPGGAFVFTDIMGADGADEKILKDFTDRNATTKMARPSEYFTLLTEAGLSEPSFLNFSPHLVHYFQSMVDQINENKEAMLEEGCSEEYLAKWMDSLTGRVDIQREHKVFAWGIFTSRLEGDVY